MKLTVDLSGSPDPVDDLNILADLACGLSSLITTATDVPGERIAISVDLLAQLIKGVAAELPRH